MPCGSALRREAWRRAPAPLSILCVAAALVAGWLGLARAAGAACEPWHNETTWGVRGCAPCGGGGQPVCGPTLICRPHHFALGPVCVKCGGAGERPCPPGALSLLFGAVGFDRPPPAAWPAAETAPGRRTILLLHGMSGNATGFYPPRPPDPGVAGEARAASSGTSGSGGGSTSGSGSRPRPAERLSAAWLDDEPLRHQNLMLHFERTKHHRVYGIDYFRRFAALPVRPDGRWDEAGAIAFGPGALPQDGVSFEHISGGIAAAVLSGRLPVDSPITLIAGSMGGFVAKDLVYRHHDLLRRHGTPIAEVIFLAHPHFAESVAPEVFMPLACGRLGETPLIDLPRASQEVTAAERAAAQDAARQICLVGKWLLGWRRILDRAPIDNRDYPQIRWITVAGTDTPLEPVFAGVTDEGIDSDRRTPVEIALGRDLYRHFGGIALDFDLRVRAPGCDHADVQCLLLALLRQHPDAIPQGPPRPGGDHVVRPGDSLWRIARLVLGDTAPADALDRYWRVLVADIGGGIPDHLAEGAVLRLPHLPETIRPGDTLRSIAQAKLGPDATQAEVVQLWTELYARNRHLIGADPDLILAGAPLLPLPAPDRAD